VNLAIFDGFKPGMTGKEAEQALGPADDYRERNGEEFWMYKRHGGRVVVAHKFKGSLVGGWWWRLEAAFDPPLPPAELLHTSIVRELPNRTDQRYSVTIMNNRTDDQAPAVSVYIEGGKIAGIDVSPSGAKGAPLGRQSNLG